MIGIISVIDGFVCIVRNEQGFKHYEKILITEKNCDIVVEGSELMFI